MAASFNLEVNNKPNRKGEYTVFIRITQNRKKKRVKTSIALRKLSDWNKDKQRIRASEPNARSWNAVLDQELEKAKSVYRELTGEGVATSSNIIRKIKNDEVKPTLLAYAKRLHGQLYAEGHLGTWQKYGTFINILEDFLTKRGKVEDISFKEVTPEFIQSFIAYLNTLKNHRTKGRLHPNTITKLLKLFRAIVNKAIDVDGYMKPEDNPFRALKISEVPIAKERLEKVELDALAALDLEPKTPKWHARNAFFFSYYCAGIRAGDLMQLRWTNITDECRLSYQMGKNHKIKDILLVKPARSILDMYKTKGMKKSDYIFPYLNNWAPYARFVTQEEKEVMPVELKQQLFSDIHNKNVQINRRLRDLLKMAGIDKHISFHISRHTFARQAKLAGTDNAILKGMLAHSSLSVTERYVGEFDTAVEDKALESIFGADTNRKTFTLTKDLLLQALKGLDKEALKELIDSLKINK